MIRARSEFVLGMVNLMSSIIMEVNFKEKMFIVGDNFLKWLCSKKITKKAVTFILLNFYCNVKVINKENYDKDKRYLVVANHTSNLDGIALHLLLDDINVVAKKNIFYAIEKDINYYVNLCYKTVVALQKIESCFKDELNPDIKEFITNAINKLNNAVSAEDKNIILHELDKVYNYYKTIKDKQLKKSFKNLKKNSKMISINSLSSKKPITWCNKPKLWGNALMNRGLIPVDRSNSFSAGRIIPTCIKRLEDDQNVAIFFQGTIMDLDKTTLENIKGGASKIAYKAKVNILPIYIQEFDYDKLTKNGRFPRLFSDYKIIIGEEIPLQDTGNPTPEQCIQLDEKALHAIKKLKSDNEGPTLKLKI